MQSSFQSLLNGLSSMYEHNLYLSSLFELLEVRSRVLPPAHPIPLPRPLAGEIAFEHVSFSYEGSDRNALRDGPGQHTVDADHGQRERGHREYERQHSEYERLDHPDEHLQPVERQRHQERHQERHHQQ